MALAPSKQISNQQWLTWLPIFGGLLALYVPTFLNLANGIWQEDEYAHGPIILIVILWLIWDKKSFLFDSQNNTAPLAGFSLLAAGLLLYILGRSQGITILDVGSLFLYLQVRY